MLPRMLPHMPDIPKNSPYIPLANEGYLQKIGHLYRLSTMWSIFHFRNYQCKILNFLEYSISATVMVTKMVEYYS